MTSPVQPPDEPASDDVARLILQAGRRRSPAAEIREPVRLAVEQAWRHSVADRRRRKTIWLAAAATVAAAAAGLSWLAFANPGTGAPLAKLVSEQGKVTFKEHHRAVLVALGARLPTGIQVRTGVSGSAVLDVASVTMHMGSTTSIRIERPDHVQLTRGRIYAARGVDREATRPLVVDTPFGRVSHLATGFQVAVDSSGMTISVRQAQPLSETSGACGSTPAQSAGCLMVADATGAH